MMGRGRVRAAIRIVGIALVAAAVHKELRKPAGERDWHGDLGGIIPYEFRPPTLFRVRERWWNPDDPRILTPHVFGVGWSVNLGRILRVLRG
jgi:hypothetical protein